MNTKRKFLNGYEYCRQSREIPIFRLFDGFKNGKLRSQFPVFVKMLC